MIDCRTICTPAEKATKTQVAQFHGQVGSQEDICWFDICLKKTDLLL